MGGHATTRPEGQEPPAEKTQASKPMTMATAATSRAMSTVFLSRYRRVALNPTMRPFQPGATAPLLEPPDPYSSSLRMSSSMLTSLKVTTRTLATKRAGRYMSHTQASWRVMSK
jgi:hypothetical protein